MAMTESIETAGVILPHALSGAQQRQVREFVQRIEHVQQEINDAQESQAEIYTEVEEAGYDKKIMKKVVKARQKSRKERETEQLKFDLYMHAVGEAT